MKALNDGSAAPVSGEAAGDAASGVCRICGARTPAEPVSATPAASDHRLARCPSCATVMTTRRPAPDELPALYDRLFSTGDYEDHRRAFHALVRGGRRWGRYRRLLLRRLERRVRGRAMIEIGGGVGGFGVLATRRGWRYRDLDISNVAVDFARRLGLDAEVFPVDAMPPLGVASADAVVMWEVLEHVWQCATLLAAVRRALRPGGCLALSTPNWQYVRTLGHWGPLASPPVHCNFFDAAALRGALRAAGFTSMRVFGRRLVWPGRGLAGALDAARVALGVTPSSTLVAFARAAPGPDTSTA